MKVGIIGAGWYGCHITKVLKSIGICVDLYEKDSEIFLHASGKNQNRLHQGFHYCRNYHTRTQTVNGFKEFLSQYGFLTKEIKDNLYIVPKLDSLIDFQTYYSIMISSGLMFDRDNSFLDKLENVEGILNTQERLIIVDEARKFFKEKIKNNIIYNTKVDLKKIDFSEPIVEDKKYDLLIDCTWGHSFKRKNIFFEPTLLIYYEYQGKEDEHPALTFVDGELPSIYPTGKEKVFTLSHVKYTPLGKYLNSEDSKQRIKRICKEEIDERKKLMEDGISKYYPSFKSEFKFLDNQLSIKTKPFGMNANRACNLHKDQKFISVMSGKIDTIFYASNEILNFIGN